MEARVERRRLHLPDPRAYLSCPTPLPPFSVPTPRRAYKILFLDVLFPLDVDRVIFVDSDQVVRTDLQQLMDLDMKVGRGGRGWGVGWAWARRVGGGRSGPRMACLW